MAAIADIPHEYTERPGEHNRGKIFVPMAAPSRRHQQISWRLTLQIGELFKHHSCDAYAAPFDVRLFDKRKSEKANKDIFTVVQPDLCVICDLENWTTVVVLARLTLLSKSYLPEIRCAR